MEKNTITNPQKCIVQRNGVELWIDAERADKLQQVLEIMTEHKFIRLEGTGCTINTADITGIYEPTLINDMKRRKNGEWKCRDAQWHQRKEVCGCSELKRYGMPLPSQVWTMMTFGH